MKVKILKQFQPSSGTVWVEKLNEDDTIELFETKAAANERVHELKQLDSTREYKIVKQ